MSCFNQTPVVVTGAGRGLGRSYALLAAAEGARVVVNDVDVELAEAVAAEICELGGAAVASGHDIVDPAQASALIDLCVDRYGSIGGLVNNAGLFHVAGPWDEDAARARRLIEVNVLGTLQCGTCALARMREQGAGSVVNVTSGAHLGMPAMGTYGASKGAVTSMTFSWALDTLGSGVRVNAVSPIAFTRMAASIGVSPVGHTMPEAIAPLVVYLLSDASRPLTGQVIRLDGKRLSVLDPAVFGEPSVVHEAWDVGAVVSAFSDGALGAPRPVGAAGAEVSTSIPVEGPLRD